MRRAEEVLDVEKRPAERRLLPSFVEAYRVTGPSFLVYRFVAPRSDCTASRSFSPPLGLPFVSLCSVKTVTEQRRMSL